MPDMSAFTGSPPVPERRHANQTTGQSQHVQTLVLLRIAPARELGAVDVPALDRSFHLRRKRSSVGRRTDAAISPPGIIIAFESRRRSSSTRVARVAAIIAHLGLVRLSPVRTFRRARERFRGKLQVEDLLLELSIAAPATEQIGNRPISALSSRACRVSRSCAERASVERARTRRRWRRGGAARKDEENPRCHTVHSAPVILTVSSTIAPTPRDCTRNRSPRRFRARPVFEVAPLRHVRAATFCTWDRERDLSLAPCSGVIKRPMRFICG